MILSKKDKQNLLYFAFYLTKKIARSIYNRLIYTIKITIELFVFCLK